MGYNPYTCSFTKHCSVNLHCSCLYYSITFLIFTFMATTNKPIMNSFISFLEDKGYIEEYKWSNEYIKDSIDGIACWTKIPSEEQSFIIHLFFYFLEDQCGIKIDTR